jgi:hypothetical protein
MVEWLTTWTATTAATTAAATAVATAATATATAAPRVDASAHVAADVAVAVAIVVVAGIAAVAVAVVAAAVAAGVHPRPGLFIKTSSAVGKVTWPTAFVPGRWAFLKCLGVFWVVLFSNKQCRWWLLAVGKRIQTSPAPALTAEAKGEEGRKGSPAITLLGRVGAERWTKTPPLTSLALHPW